MLRLSISIMHCSWNQERVQMLSQIMERLQPHLNLLEKFTICDDVNKNGIWWNCKEAWRARGHRSTHHLVLQDDMLPCQNIIPALLQIIEVKTTEIIHIFASNAAIHQAIEQNKHWYTTPEGSWGGAVLLSRFDFDWYEWADKHLSISSKHRDDVRMDDYVLCHEKKLWCTAPSLIEHIGYDKSLIGHVAANWRKSRLYIGDQDPLQLDWSQGANEPLQGNLTWSTAYDQLHEDLKPEYREFFMKKLQYQSKLNFPH